MTELYKRQIREEAALAAHFRLVGAAFTERRAMAEEALAFRRELVLGNWRRIETVERQLLLLPVVEARARVAMSLQAVDAFDFMRVAEQIAAEVVLRHAILVEEAGVSHALRAEIRRKRQEQANRAWQLRYVVPIYEGSRVNVREALNLPPIQPRDIPFAHPTALDTTLTSSPSGVAKLSYSVRDSSTMRSTSISSPLRLADRSFLSLTSGTVLTDVGSRDLARPPSRNSWLRWMLPAALEPALAANPHATPEAVSRQLRKERFENGGASPTLRRSPSAASAVTPVRRHTADRSFGAMTPTPIAGSPALYQRTALRQSVARSRSMQLPPVFDRPTFS
jgi:hypothetical protein